MLFSVHRCSWCRVWSSLVKEFYEKCLFENAPVLLCLFNPNETKGNSKSTRTCHRKCTKGNNIVEIVDVQSAWRTHTDCFLLCSQLALEYGIKFMETSAKANINVENVSCKSVCLENSQWKQLHGDEESVCFFCLQAFMALARDIKAKIDKKQVRT